MNRDYDRRFLNLVSVVIGGLIGLAVGIFVLALYVGAHAESAGADDAEYRQQLRERIAPFGTVAVAGRDNAAIAIAGAAPAAAVSTTILSGADAYGSACVACHGAGIGGAPKFGDKAAWAPRLAQGISVLHQHALAGLQGKAGVMPAKGGRPDLADQSVVNAVDYIVAAAK